MLRQHPSTDNSFHKKVPPFYRKDLLITYVLICFSTSTLPRYYDREHTALLCIVHIDEVFAAGKPAQVKWKDLSVHQVLKFIRPHLSALAVYHFNLELFVLVAVELQAEPSVVWIWPDADRFLEDIMALFTIMHHYIFKTARCTTKAIGYRVGYPRYTQSCYCRVERVTNHTRTTPYSTGR